MNETELKLYIRGLREKHDRLIQRLQKQLERAAREERRLNYQLARACRRVPSPDILPGLVARRRAAFPLPSAKAAAEAREERFAKVSSSYREETLLDESDILATIDHVELWVPGKYADKIRLPWSMIQQVRSAAVGGIMLDIGANIGQTSVPRILLGDFEAIYAAEPSPGNYARLKATVAANGVRGFVLPDRVAIGSHDGTVRFRVGHYRSQAVAAESDLKVIDVPLLTLDSWVDRLGIDVDAISFVKTDTNGYEVDVLRGAARLLSKRLAVWQIEVAPAAMAHLDAPLQTLIDELAGHFTHFIDLSLKARGAVVRPISEMADGLAYLDTMHITKGGKPPQTDLLCLNC